MPPVSAADERWEAARSDKADVSALAAALADERDPRVQEALFTALSRLATQESARAVLPFLGSDDSGLRTRAFDALRAMPDAAKPCLPQLLADPDADVRLLACDLARDMRGADGLLYALLDTEREANVCAAAVEVLAEIADARALPVLARCAARFADVPFLAFAIKIAAERAGARPARE